MTISKLSETEPSAERWSCANPTQTQGNIEPESPEEDLLQRFVTEQDESAFALLVSRHAGMVMGVCRRALGSEHDAEDAFQATFLILAKKASTVRDARVLPAWLYQTAYRVALRARSQRMRRSELPLEAEVMTESETLTRIASEHELAVIDEELNRLPEKYRLVLFLCCVESKSRNEAAEQLGLSVNAVKGRLQRGRDLLRQRLVLRGVSLSVTAGVTLGLQQAVQAAQSVAPSLIASTTQAAVGHATGNGSLGCASPNVTSLANGSLHIMSLANSKIVAVCLCVICAATVASSIVVTPTNAGDTASTTIELTSESHLAEAKPSFEVVPDKQSGSVDRNSGRANTAGRRSVNNRRMEHLGKAPNGLRRGGRSD